MISHLGRALHISPLAIESITCSASLSVFLVEGKLKGKHPEGPLKKTPDTKTSVLMIIHCLNPFGLQNMCFFILEYGQFTTEYAKAFFSFGVWTFVGLWTF